MTDRISPEDVALLRAIREVMTNGASMTGPSGGGPVLSRRKATLGRVIDVRWSFPVVNQFFDQVGPFYPAQRFGRVEYMPDEPGQLEEEDWLIQAQPLDVLENDRALPRVIAPTEGQPPFFRRLLPLSTNLNPQAWWPYDTTDGSPLVPNVGGIAGSPFWLVVESGPENGTLQRVPIPIVGTTIAVRGRNVAASIEYNPAFAALAQVVQPFEAPYLLDGAGKILVTITKAQPVTRVDPDQLRTVQLRLLTPTFPIGGLAWIPKFARRVFGDPRFFEFLDQTGYAIPGFYSGENGISIPQNAVALRQAPSDDTSPNCIAFEVFS